MRRHLMVHLPQYNSVKGCDWERMLGAGVRGRVVGTGAREGGKLLFDVLADRPTGRVGFSAKTLSGPVDLTRLPGSGRSFDFVIRRPKEVIAHGELVTSAAKLGNRLVADFNAHRDGSILTQGVDQSRMGLLLRSKDERSHLYWEAECTALEMEHLAWHWTDQERASVSGYCNDCGALMYRYFLRGNHLFGRFEVPDSAQLIRTPFLQLDELPVAELYKFFYERER